MRLDRRSYPIASSRGTLEEGHVVRFRVDADGRAIGGARVAFRGRTKSLGYPAGLYGLVVAIAGGEASIVSDRGEPFTRVVAEDDQIDVGDRVSFRVMADDSLAWDLTRTAEAAEARAVHMEVYNEERALARRAPRERLKLNPWAPPVDERLPRRESERARAREKI